MSREKKLAKNTIIISIGNICTKLITFLLLPLYTGVLSTAEYGTVDLLNTLISLLVPIITFQVEQAVFRDLIEVRENKNSQKDIISSSIASVVLQCVTFILFYFIISLFINNNYKIYLMINIIAYIFASLFLQIARGIGNNKQYAIGSFISASTTIVFNIIFLTVFKFKVEGMLLGTLLGQIISAIYLVFVLKIYNLFSLRNVSKKIVLNLWKYSLPLVPNAISWWVFSASDRVIATSFLGVSENGILAAALKFSSIYITLYNIFNISWTESISVCINDKDISDYFNKMFNVIMRLFTALGIGMIACMPFVFPIMINEKFGSGYGLVPISILGSLFNVVVGLISVIYIAKKNTKAIANTSIISAIVNIFVHLLLIKFIGLYAAVISTFIAFFTMSIYRMHDIRKKYFEIKIDKGLLIKTVIILLMILPIYYINNLYLNIFALLLAILFAWNLNKDSIKPILDMVKSKLKSA